MKDKYVYARTCVYNINYHIVWCVKYRKSVLTPKICDRLYELMHSIADEKGFSVVDCKVGEGDHIHCFVSAPPKIFVSQILKYLKGITGNTLLKEFSEIRKSLWGGQNVIKKDLSLRQVEEYFENVLDIYDMDCEINQFVNQYFGTSIGESIRNKRMNVSDDDYDSIKEIYKEVYEW